MAIGYYDRPKIREILLVKPTIYFGENHPRYAKESYRFPRTIIDVFNYYELDSELEPRKYPATRRISALNLGLELINPEKSAFIANHNIFISCHGGFSWEPIQDRKIPYFGIHTQRCTLLIERRKGHFLIEPRIKSLNPKKIQQAIQKFRKD